MRKPNTSLRGYEAPSMQIARHESRLAGCSLLTGMRGAARGRTFAADRLLPGLPHLKISNTG